MTDQPQYSPEKFGTIVGMAPGNVPVYSSDYQSADDTEFPDRQSYRSFVGDVYMGQKWQCVEFARRWLYLNRGYVFADVAMAYDIFRLTSVSVVSDGTSLPIRSFLNGSRRRPEPGCMLIWDEGGVFSTTGHVAIVTDVSDDCVRVVEQNFAHHRWAEGQLFSRELMATASPDGEYRLKCTAEDGTILGWVIQTGDDACAEVIEEIDHRLLNLQLREIETGKKATQTWLDLTSRDEAAFVASMEGHTLVTDPADQTKYFRVSESALIELKRATNELHALFMMATEHVLSNNSLLEKFNIPRSIWPRMRRSWSNRRNEMITGRFDFAMSDRGLKVYEYNCDSASCHMECGKVQGKWAEHFECKDGFDAGRSLQERLVSAWRRQQINGVLHIMYDRDLEETYHAAYMQKIVEAAGIPTRLIRGISGLSWDGDGDVCDPDGVKIKWVWKTWAWETALDQIRVECEGDDETTLDDLQAREKHSAPRLVDVLLRKGVMVFEPLWTLIPSNKAILPVLWRLCPNHPYLLNSAFELRDSLLKSGYAVKPIVGRGGSNISLIDRASTKIAETGGGFDGRDQVYQEIWKLPAIDGIHVQVSTFTAGGSYGGAGVRIDRSVVINMDSDCFPLRVVTDNEHLEYV
jgi:glutathionylspermidine amidase/synthetase